MQKIHKQVDYGNPETRHSLK